MLPIGTPGDLKAPRANSKADAESPSRRFKLAGASGQWPAPSPPPPARCAAGVMPVPHTLRLASMPHPIPVVVNRTWVRHNASSSARSGAKACGRMACARHSGLSGASPPSLHATLVSPLAPRASGMCGGGWAGALRSLPRGPVSAMTTPWPPGAKPSGPYAKKAHGEQRTLGFIAATGFMLQPTVRRTWAPRGHTPIHHRRDHHDRLSGTGAITISPGRQRLGGYGAMSPHHLPGDDLFAFVQPLRGHRNRPWRILGDRWSGQQHAARLLDALYGKRMQSEALPA